MEISRIGERARLASAVLAMHIFFLVSRKKWQIR